MAIEIDSSAAHRATNHILEAESSRLHVREAGSQVDEKTLKIPHEVASSTSDEDTQGESIQFTTNVTVVP